MDISALERIGFDVKKGLVVVNYFNKQIGDLHTASDLNDYCNGYLNKFRKVYFLMLHYKDGINKDGMSFQQATDFYSRLEEDERRTFEEKITELERTQPGAKAGVGKKTTRIFRVTTRCRQGMTRGGIPCLLHSSGDHLVVRNARASKAHFTPTINCCIPQIRQLILSCGTQQVQEDVKKSLGVKSVVEAMQRILLLDVCRTVPRQYWTD
jgi:hypothetical protein